MKKSIYLLGGLLCLFFTACNASGQSSSDEILIEETMQEKPAYVEAYTAFLLDENTDRGHDFPIRGYYLFDLNFDDIPELGILHDSWGSMGGYFTIYYFDGKDVTAVLNDRGEPAGISNYTQILADFEQKKVYFLKEMYLLVGNNNGTYGYVREVKSEDGVPCVYDILNLEVDWESDMGSLIEISLGKDYIGEDTFLSDPELEDYLITQCYEGKEWMDISLSEYLRQKRELIPEENSFVDLRDLDMNYLGVNYDEDGFYTDVRMEKEEIEQLFRRYVESLK
ncbi:MAG: hypothetical protein HDR27_01200 [Lachnospiraceae bacterium]|nr:hypothetical protein [Lachnospiraceae bacterium]